MLAGANVQNQSSNISTGQGGSLNANIQQASGMLGGIPTQVIVADLTNFEGVGQNPQQNVNISDMENGAVPQPASQPPQSAPNQPNQGQNIQSILNQFGLGNLGAEIQNGNIDVQVQVVQENENSSNPSGIQTNTAAQTTQDQPTQIGPTHPTAPIQLAATELNQSVP